ncbi:MAG: phosphate ABC transporter permease PstA [Eubacteriales bacterium]|nr:phosphate ABC transporter permease PstA [Eubacteriales bacterium]
METIMEEKYMEVQAINRQTWPQRLKSYKRSPLSLILLVLVSLSALLTVLTLLFLIAYILVKGIPYLTPSLFAWEYNSENVSLMPALINTVIMTALSLLIAGPLGIFAAIYLVEYARRGNKLVSLVRVTAETLSGIPSIVYGLFGFLLFAVTFGWSYTILGGAMTLAIMILPLIMRTTEEALKSVPDSYREGSFGLGAGRLRTVFRIVLPSAVPGILAGVILAVGRIVGETAALMYTAGTVAGIPDNLFGSGRTLAVHMYVLTNEGLYTNQSYATAVVLLAIVVCINAVSGVIAKKVAGKNK